MAYLLFTANISAVVAPSPPCCTSYRSWSSFQSSSVTVASSLHLLHPLLMPQPQGRQNFQNYTVLQPHLWTVVLAASLASYGPHWCPTGAFIHPPLSASPRGFYCLLPMALSYFLSLPGFEVHSFPPLPTSLSSRSNGVSHCC